MKRKNKLITAFLLLITFSIQTQLIYASNNNFLNVKIEEENESLTIKEEWNVILKDSNLFERELAIDKACISNVSVYQKFPVSSALSFTEKYSASDNITTINTSTGSKNGESTVLILEYKLNLDNKTKLDFLNNLPHSLSTNNMYGIKKMKLDLDTNEYNYSGKVNFEINDGFTQKTSKSKTIEVFIQLFKLLINIIVIGTVCFICYIGALALYYRSIKNKKQRNQLKKIKSNKRIIVSNKRNLLKTRI